MKKFKSFIQYLKETESLIFNDINHILGYDVTSNEMIFTFTQENAKQIFKILNNRIFKNKLKPIKINIVDISSIDNANNKHAVYYRRYDEYKLLNMQFIIIDEYYVLPNYKMSISLAVNIFCHEMIHCYNEHFDNLAQKRTMWRITHNFKEYNSHNSDFKRLQIKANNMGLNVLEYTMGNNEKQLSDISAKKAKQFALSEDEMVEKMKAMSPKDFMNALSIMVKHSKNMFWDKNGGLCIIDS